MIVRNKQHGYIECIRSSIIDWIPLGYMDSPVKYIMHGYSKTCVPDVLSDLGIDRVI